MEPLSSYRPSRYSQQNCNLKQKKNKKQKTSQGWKALRCIAKADLLIHPVFLVFFVVVLVRQTVAALQIIGSLRSRVHPPLRSMSFDHK